MILSWSQVLCFSAILTISLADSHQKIGKLDRGIIITKPSKLSALVLLEEPPQYFDLNVDCTASANLKVINAKCGCSDFICILNYKFIRLRSIQNCHDICCRRRSVKSVATLRTRTGDQDKGSVAAVVVNQ